MKLCDKRYNEVAYLCTHNAYNSSKDGFLLPNQTHNIQQQLDAGVRALMIDVYERDSVIVVYHGLFALGLEPVATYLADIKRFLDNNPKEIITIILECNITSNQVEQELANAGLMSYLYAHNSANPWPTLQTMIDNNTRLVIFSGCNDAAPGQDWYHHGGDYFLETSFSAKKQADLSCNLIYGDSTKDLFVLNHFITQSAVGTGEPDTAAIINANPFFIDRAMECQTAHNKLPNFVAVDFYELGDCLDAINLLNGVPLSIESPVVASFTDIKVYPNPASDHVIIEGEGLFLDDFVIYNVLGQDMSGLITFERVDRFSIKLGTQQLERGIYFVGLDQRAVRVFVE